MNLSSWWIKLKIFRASFALGLILYLISSIFNPAYAHFLASDNNIGAILHVDPNDEPIAKEQASFFFEFKDKQNKFDPANCDCTFLIVENGKTIYSQPLFQNSSKPSLTNASVFYTFPQRDVYQVKVVGKPITPNAFQAFTLSWDFRIDQIAESQSTTPQQNNFFTEHFSHILIISILIILFLVYLAYRNFYTAEKHSKKGGE